MNHKSGRYSKYLKIINISIHLLLLNLTIYYFDDAILANLNHFVYIDLIWLIIAYLSNFYATYRFTNLTKIITRLVVQYIIFVLSYISYYAITQQNFNNITQIKILLSILIGLIFVRLFFFVSLRIYRIKGGNYRRVVIIGCGANDRTLKEFFKTRTEFGYKLLGTFSNKNISSDGCRGSILQSFDFILNNDIDEIYCSLGDLTKIQIQKFIKFSEENYKILKFIPKANDFLKNDPHVEYYDYIPIVTLRNNPLHNPINKLIKRIFDILFSSVIILTVLSWLTPLLFILIKLESKGPLFFKQIREGLNGKRFNCYKFRSMHINKLQDIIQTTKNDNRITKIGKFIRKTSIDELPQFFNVFIGNMSIVGPRPHMLSQGKRYKEVVNKYAVRHFVKPGITGLAQVKGFRGEIDKKSDIQNRVKFDLFYIENWSFLLDLKIILQTIFNAFKGEEKAY